jgi:hypothetical protein
MERISVALLYIFNTLKNETILHGLLMLHGGKE